MDSETPVLKWTAAAVGVILVCFCLGYFVFGHSVPQGTGTTVDANAITTVPDATPTPVQVAMGSGPGLIVDERTDEIAAKQAKAEEAAKAKAAAEAKKQADAEAKAQAEKAAAEASLANATPSPDPSPGDPNNPDASGVNGASGNTSADANNPPAKDPNAQPPAPDVNYRVRVGSYASRDSAKGMATELNGRGYAAIIVAEKSDGKTTYRLQVGAYRDKKAADATQQELQANGYDATVSE